MSTVKSSFVPIIKKLLRHPHIQKLQYFSSHRVKPPSEIYNRLKHSIRIGYFAHKLSKLFLQDQKYCIRAGLLHDIGYATVTPKFAQDHNFNHSLAGVKLLQRMNEPSIIVEAARTHMFPLGPYPQTIFSFVIWLADKLDWIIHLLKLKRFFNQYIANLSNKG